MKNKIEVETYRFIGDSASNKVKKLENINGKREITGNYTQTSVIKALNDCKKYIVSGRKINTGLEDRVTYQVDLGKDAEHISQIVQIVMDKSNLDKADPNALAIENLCKYSIEVKHKNIRANIAIALALLGGVAIFAGSFKYADKKESEYMVTNDLTTPDSIVESEDYNHYKEIEDELDFANRSDLDISDDEYSTGRSY